MDKLKLENQITILKKQLIDTEECLEQSKAMVSRLENVISDAEIFLVGKVEKVFNSNCSWTEMEYKAYLAAKDLLQVFKEKSKGHYDKSTSLKYEMENKLKLSNEIN